MLSIELKFDMYNIDHRPTYDIDFCVHRSYRFFTGYTKFLTLRPVDSKCLKCILMLLNYINSSKTDVYIITLNMYVYHSKLCA